MVPDQLLDKLHEKHGERKSQWTKFFAKWDKPVANPQKEAIPYEYLTGDNEYFDKRKLTPVSSTRPIKKSKYRKIIKYKKVKKKTCPNVAINGINPVGEKSVQQFQDNRNACEEKVLPPVPGENLCNELDRRDSIFRTDVDANKFHSKLLYHAKSRGNGNAYEEKVLLPVPRESLFNEVDRRDSILKIDVAADKSRSKLSYPTKSRDNRSGCEVKVIPTVPKECVSNGTDRSNSSLKIDMAANKSHSKCFDPTKSRDYKNGCEHKKLPSVSGESVYNRMDGQSSSYETAEATNNFHALHSKSSKSKDYKYHRRRSSTSYHQISFSQPKPKPWGYVIVESDPSDEEDSLRVAY